MKKRTEALRESSQLSQIVTRRNREIKIITEFSEKLKALYNKFFLSS